MNYLKEEVDIKSLVGKLNFKEKVDRAMSLIDTFYKKFGDNLIIANSLGKRVN